MRRGPAARDGVRWKRGRFRRHAEAQPGPAALEAELGVDLLAMLAAIGVPVVEAVPVTTIRWAGSPRASFRLTLADGQVLKGRRLAAPADVIRIASLSSLLDPRYFPPVLAFRGRALLTRWITGPAGEPPCGWTSARLRLRPPPGGHPPAPCLPRDRITAATGARLGWATRPVAPRARRLGGSRRPGGQGGRPVGRPLRPRDGKHRRVSHGLLRRQHHHHRREADLRRRQRGNHPRFLRIRPRADMVPDGP